MGKKQDKKVHVKQLRKEVQEKLAVALADYRNIFSDGRYSKTLKKASKLFVSSVDNANGKVREKRAKLETQEAKPQ
jgi:hypothetical protein